MGLFSKLFSSNKKHPFPYSVDMHSHLLPGIDDGSQSFEESFELLKEFEKLGIKKAITTPHIMEDYYKNSPEIILPLAKELNKKAKENNIDVEVEAAAEYYFDEFFIERVKNNGDLLTFGNNYILIETSFMNRPEQLEEIFFDLKTKGFNPVFAHPERYTYMWDNLEGYRDLHDRGVLFQINLVSLSGYYSPKAKRAAEWLIDNQLVDLVGTDCHNQRHIDAIEKTLSSKYIEKLAAANLLNDTL